MGEDLTGRHSIPLARSNAGLSVFAPEGTGKMATKTHKPAQAETPVVESTVVETPVEPTTVEPTVVAEQTPVELTPEQTELADEVARMKADRAALDAKI